MIPQKNIYPITVMLPVYAIKPINTVVNKHVDVR